MNLDGRHVLRTPNVGAAGIYGVYVILILKARQTSHKGQQSLIKLNAKASNIYVEVFLVKIICMGLVGIQALSYRNSSCRIFVFF